MPPGSKNKKSRTPLQAGRDSDYLENRFSPHLSAQLLNEAGWGKLVLNPAVCGQKSWVAAQKKIPNRLASAVWDYEFLNNLNTALVPVLPLLKLQEVKPAGASWSLKPRR
jgi:hypothetical protein